MKYALTLFVLLTGHFVFSQEICNNALDDDGDSQIDLNDEDCGCNGTAPGGPVSLLLNPSFEESVCCPQAPGELNCTEDWLSYTLGTPDYFDACGFMPLFVPQPIPDGDGVAAAGALVDLTGNTSIEYIGTCLSGALATGTSAVLDFSIAAGNFENIFANVIPLAAGPIEIVVYGFPNCPALQSVPTSGCPEAFGWYQLGSIVYQPQNVWEQISIPLNVPETTGGIMIGAGCNVPADTYSNWTGTGSVTFLFDAFSLIADTEEVVITQSGGNCLEDLIIVAPDGNYGYQWYFDNIALVGEDNLELNLGATNYNQGEYTLLVNDFDQGECFFLEAQVSETQLPDPSFAANIISGCAPLSVQFSNLTDDIQVASALWNFQAGTATGDAPSFVFNAPGSYSITLTVTTPGGCVQEISIPNYINVLPSDIPEIFTSVTAACAPFNVLFSSASNADACSWDFGNGFSSTSCASISTFDTPGTYEVSLLVNEGTDCPRENSIELTLADTDPPSVEIFGVSSFCEGETITLIASGDQGTLAWDNGQSGPEIQVTEGGTYGVVLTRADGCKASDDKTVDEIRLPLFEPFPTVNACEGDPLSILAFAGDANIRWPGLSENERLTITQSGIYVAEAENLCGVSTAEFEVLLRDCSCEVFIPNSFTPNEDGLNDLFSVSISCPVRSFELSVFNRWGNQVFSSNDPDVKWNGSASQSGDFYSEPGIYSYVLMYENALRPIAEIQTRRGTVNLLR